MGNFESLTLLEPLLNRRAIKVFDPCEIESKVRDQILQAAHVAPSSLNLQPYLIYWVETSDMKKEVAKLCLGQTPAETASALAIVVADLSSWESTSHLELQWLRENSAVPEKLLAYENKLQKKKVLFAQGYFGIIGGIKKILFGLNNLLKVDMIPPCTRSDLFKWAAKSASLACGNLMIACESLGLNTCPMEGFDQRRLLKFLKLSSNLNEIVMVIAIGNKSKQHRNEPQWRRPIETTVKFI